MKIQALKFIATPSDSEPLRIELEFESQKDIEKAREADLPAVYLVTEEDLPKFHQFKDVIVDRKKKNRHKGLSEYLLGLKHSKIPIINGNYENTSQLKRGIRTLLSKALMTGERNLFIIGVKRSLFSDLWQKSDGSSSRQSSKRGSKKTACGYESDTDALRMLDYLKSRNHEPEYLAERYVGNSIDAQLIRQYIVQAAQTDTPVLIMGDTGTGKEVIARQIHECGSRKSRNFVPVNCGAIPYYLFESELFGHKKGAFANAFFDKMGLWEYADSGTLFLDEIADLKPDHQVKILRALEDGMIRRVGSNKEIKVNARILAATNRDLYAAVQAEEFREDLYYRLKYFPIRTSPLRERQEDIPLLANFFWKSLTKDDKRSLPEDILYELQSYGWPGNARELKTVLATLQSMFDADNIGKEQVRLAFYLTGQRTVSGADIAPKGRKSLQRFESLRHLRRVNEELHTLQTTTSPIMEKHKIDSASFNSMQVALNFRLNELEMLCRQPSLFSNETTFSKVYSFTGKLRYLQDLLQQDNKKARQYWNDEIARELKSTMSSIQKELGSVADRS